VSSDQEARRTPASLGRIQCQSRSQSPKLRRTVLWRLLFVTTITYLLLPHLAHAQESDSAASTGRYTGTYGQLDLNWAMTSRASFAIQAVRFDVSDVIRRAGGHDSDYLGVQIAYGL
jgi:hypothetical protein